MTQQARITKLLGKGAQSPLSRFALVDAAATAAVTDNDEIYNRLSRPEVVKYTLFTGENAWAAERSAPYLVPLDEQPEIEAWLLENGWGRGWAVFFAADAQAIELVDHLRRFLDVQAENGRNVFFRFFDPVILHEFLLLLDKREAALFFGPIQRFVLEDEHQQPMYFDKPQDTPAKDGSPSALVLGKRHLFAAGWNRRLMAAHQRQYEALGLMVTADLAQNALTIEEKDGSQATLQKTNTGVTVTTGEGRRFQYELTGCKNLSAIVDPAGNRIEMDVQERENIVTKSKQSLLHAVRAEHNRKTWVFDYDRRNHLERIDYPDGADVRFEHDAYGNLLSHVDRNGKETRFERDNQERLARLVDTNGHATVFEYQDRMAPASIAFADGRTFAFEYTDAGHLKSFLAGDQRVAHYTVDPNSGSWSVQYHDGTRARFEVENGLIVRAENDAGSVILTYDDQGRLAAETFNHRTVTYQRNESGQLTGIVGPEGPAIAFGRDGEQRVDRITDWSGRAIAIQYAANGAMEKIDFPNGVQLHQNTRASGLPEEMILSHRQQDKTFFRRRISRDRMERVTRIRDAIKTIDYRYDKQGRILAARCDLAPFDEAFEIDAKANRLADHHRRYQVNAADRIEQTDFDFDALGNQTHGIGPQGRISFEWGAANRLGAASVGQTRVSYKYDAFGRRVEKIVNGRRTSTVWAGAQPLQEIVSDNGGEHTIDYLFFPGTPVLLAMRDDGRIRYAAFGHRYETLCLTDAKGKLVWQADYDAFGNAYIETGHDIFQPFRLAGHYRDEETGLHYSAARYYDPSLGRYLSLDPLFMDGGGDNFYAYCNGDPINGIDPTGEFIFCAILIGAAIGAAIGAGLEYYRQKQSGPEVDGYKIAKAALIGGAIGAIGGGVGAAVEGAVAAGAAGTVLAESAMASMAATGFLSGAASSVAEQCAESALTDKAVSPLEITKQMAIDGVIGAAIGLVTFGVGGVLARRSRKAGTEIAEAATDARRLKSNQLAVSKNAEVSPQARQAGAQKTSHVDKSTVGEPVNAVTGEVFLNQTDFTLPGRMPLVWTRHYGSQQTYSGMLGRGWQTPADARLALEEDMVVFYDGSPGGAVFQRLPGETPEMEMTSGALLSAVSEGYQVRLKSGWVYHFGREFIDDLSPVIRISDPNSNRVQFVREKGRLIAIADSSGRTIQVETHQGRITAMHYQERRLVAYRYQGDHLMVAIDALGYGRRFQYRHGRMVRHSDRNLISFHYEYDTKGRCIHSHGDNGLYDYRLEYLPFQRCTRVTNSLGHISHYHYDANRLPTQVVDGNGAVTFYEYDEVGRVACITDPLERITRYRYDNAGNVVEITRPDESRIVVVYDRQHRPIQILDPGDNIWEQQYDRDGHLVARISPLGHTTTYQYYPSGDLSLITDPEGRMTGFAWDQTGLLTAMIDPSGRRTLYQRDQMGYVTAVIDPSGAATRYSYDESNRLCTVASPSGLRQAFDWDPEDNLLLYTDAAGQQTRFEYTGLNELARRINADGTSVQYHYDTEEQLTGITNEKGQTHGFAYDAAGHVIRQTDYWGHSRRYVYDPAGQLLQRIDPLARTVAYAYDPLGRMITKLFESEERETFRWDPTGNLIAFESPDLRIERTFDPDGRLTAEKSPRFTVRYDHDRNGRRVGRTTSAGNQIRYAYDDGGLLSYLTINDQSPLQFDRNKLGQITTEKLGGQMVRTYSYDEEGRLVHQRITSELHRIERRFDFDLVGNLIGRHDSGKGTWRFDYDPLGRIIESIDPLEQVQRHVYDPAGDLLSHLPEAQDGLRSATHRGRTYRFDAAGNLVRREENGQSSRLDWDEQHRLRTVHTPEDTTVRMAYDALGRRVRKSVDGRRTFFAWDGDALLAEQFEDQPAREYVYYPGTFEPLALIDHDGRIYYYHNDPNGLPQELTRPNGEVVWSAAYDARGRITELLADQVTQPLRLQGQYFDPEIDLCYNRHRYFDPRICSFISQDPIGLAGGENVYAFAPNVWSWVDPLGLSCSMTPPKKPIVLGETMNKRVEPVAELLDAHTFQPRSKDPTRWKINQKRWIRDQIKSERDIFDIGTDRLRPSRSEYYAIERGELLKAGYEREFQKWISVDVGGNTKKFRLYKWVKVK